MPNKRERTKAEKEKSRMAAMRRLAAYQKSLTRPAKRKPVKKVKESLLSKVKKRLGKLFSGSKYSTSRTRQTQEQLKAAKVDIKSDLEKAKGKKKNNPHKKSGGY